MSALSTGVVFGRLLGLVGGTTVTGVVLQIGTAAAGTNPTTARFGIANSAGQILAISANLNASTSWGTVGQAAFPFSAPISAPSTGGYYACWLVVGTWGTTQVGCYRGIFPGGGAAANSGAVRWFEWTGQSDLPIVGNSLTLTNTSTPTFYAGFY
jgi:hypothetical protein